MSEVYFSLSSGNFSQNWSDIGLLTTSTTTTGTNDANLASWANVPSIVGFLGDNLTSLTGADPSTLTGSTLIANLIANQTNPNTQTSGGVAEFHLTDPTVALQGSGTADAPYLAIYLDSTGRQNVTLSFNARDIDGSADNAVQPLVVQYRIGSTGAWVTVPGSLIPDATTGPSLATQVTPVTVTLPAEANNQPQLQVRIMTANAVGSDEWIGIDDISVVSDAAGPAAQPGILSINDVTMPEGDSGSTDMVFTVTRSSGSDGAVSATWTLNLNGTANAADFAGAATTGTVTFAAGQTTAEIRIPVAGDTAFEPNETFSVTLSAPTGGATLGDASGTGTIASDDMPPLANVFVSELVYDPAGTDAGEFVEITGLAGTDLTGWSIVLYNGNGGAAYGTYALSGTLADTANGFGATRVLTPGLQNGAPDGVAVVDAFGRVVQFISYEGTMTATSGAAAGMTSTDIGVEQGNDAVGTSLQLIGTGSSVSDFTWVQGATSSAGVPNSGMTFLSGTDAGQIRINDARVTEGDSGTTTMTFTLVRAGGFASVATVDWTLNLTGSASAADLGAGAALAGTVTFGANEFVRTITVPISTDTLGEMNETFTVTLSNVTGNATIVDATATGTIANDDPIALSIMAIQGEGHTSAVAGQPVITTGIVTAVDATGFYLQDPNGDGNARTSDGIFIYTGAAPTVAVGDAISVTGRVVEYGTAGNLTLTEINATNVVVTSSGNALPTAVVIGTDGILPPTDTMEDDGFTSFDPATDGLDFWESLEGMRVTVQNPIVVANTNGFGETDVVASLGAGATGMNDRGGITISAGDFNPERIQIDSRWGGSFGYAPSHTTGDQLADVTGVLNYSFSRYELIATQAVTVTQDVTLTDNNTTLRGDANYLSIATYNVENLDPSDNKFDIIGDDIIYSLGAPTIIALQEIQDGDGAGTGSDLSGLVTVQGLIDAIFTESGIRYTYVEIAPTTANSTGGEPNGNIRNGYLYRADLVTLVPGSLSVVNDPAFNGSRQPLVATWLFNDQTVTTINVHFTSRIGSDPLMGSTQPPVDGGDGARTAQAAALGAYVNNQLATDPDANFVLLGDWNGFYFEPAQTQLTAGGVFTNLATLLPEAERYSYVFDGNAQLIDNILVTQGLTLGAQYDAVHINAQVGPAGRPTDHDPQVALLLMGITPHDLTLSNSTVAENQPAGTVVGTLSATDSPTDTLTYALVDDAGGRFTVDPQTGVITTAAAFDFESGVTSYSVVARVTDSAGLNSTTTLTIAVTNVNEAPVAVADSIAVNEDATSDNLWSLLLGNDTDVDAGDTLTITAVDGSATLGTLVFDPATQTLRYVADDDTFDALAPGATATDRFTYTVTDAGGLTHTATVSVTVTGIADGVTLNGGNGIDHLMGTGGEDVLFGGNGDDVLNGGAGHDWLFGQRGNDTLTGGTGRDTFVFGKATGADIITDFDTTSDRLLLTDGTTVRRATALDVNGDGILDLRIDLANGGSVSLLGVSSLTDVAIDLGSGVVDHDWYLPEVVCSISDPLNDGFF